MTHPAFTPAQREANARLIAEAPAMADALRGIGVTDDEGEGTCSAEHMAEIRAILARIGGATDGDLAAVVADREA